MKSQKVILTVTSILVVLVIVGVLLSITFKDNGLDKNISVTNESIANTLTYANEKLGVQFEYPKNIGAVTETIYDYTQDDNQTPFTGKAIHLAVKFSENSTIYIIGVSPDFSHLYEEGYKGNANLASVCKNSSVIENESYCINKYIADQNTYDRIYFDAPECSPHFVRQVQLNSNNSNYPGIRIYQSFFIYGKWDCGSSEEEFAKVTNVELKRLVEESLQTEVEKEKMDNFDTLLQSFRFIE